MSEYYKSAYTGAQIDEAVGAILESDILTVALDAQAAAEHAEQAAEKAESAGSLPTVTTEDNGKILRVVDGVWAAETVETAEEASF